MERNRIIALTKLTEDRKAQIRALEAACRVHDGTEAVAELSGELNFSRRLKCFFMYCEDDRPIGFMEVFCPDGKNAEITAFVAPERRQQGIFAAMYEAADTELLDRGVRNILVVAEPASVDAAAAAKKMGAELRYSELLMRLEGDMIGEPEIGSLSGHGTETAVPDGRDKQAEGQDGCGQQAEDLDRWDKKATGQEQVRREDFDLAVIPVCKDGEVSLFESDDGGNELFYCFSCGDSELGHAGVYVGEHELFIFGVEIEEKYRGKGHGTAFTRALIHELKGRFPDKQIKLQVRSDNVPAMKLYVRCGFVIETQRDYYAIRVYS